VHVDHVDAPAANLLGQSGRFGIVAELAASLVRRDLREMIGRRLERSHERLERFRLGADGEYLELFPIQVSRKQLDVLFHASHLDAVREEEHAQTFTRIARRRVFAWRL
jgi:hypothetical protein